MFITAFLDLNKRLKKSKYDFFFIKKLRISFLIISSKNKKKNNFLPGVSQRP